MSKNPEALFDIAALHHFKMNYSL